MGYTRQDFYNAGQRKGVCKQWTFIKEGKKRSRRNVEWVETNADSVLDQAEELFFDNEEEAGSCKTE
jgi:hypothetical protein